MLTDDVSTGGKIVALRKESVDRNMLYNTSGLMKCQSLSARRAWIEMSDIPANYDATSVALRKESVDRNDTDVGIPNANTGRSPQGERG